MMKKHKRGLFGWSQNLSSESLQTKIIIYAYRMFDEFPATLLLHRCYIFLHLMCQVLHVSVFIFLLIWPKLYCSFMMLRTEYDIIHFLLVLIWDDELLNECSLNQRDQPAPLILGNHVFSKRKKHVLHLTTLYKHAFLTLFHVRVHDEILHFFRKACRVKLLQDVR